MLPSLNERRFLTRLSSRGSENANPRVERVLAYSRLFLAITSLVAALLQPLAPPYYDWLAVILLIFYTLHSLALLIWLHFNPAPGMRFVRWAQAGDMVWPMLLCLFTDAPSSVFFIFFLFALMAAAFRWGFQETVAMALLSVFVLLLQAGIVAWGPDFLQRLLFTDLEIHRLIVRVGYLLLTGLLLGYLSEGEKELRAEIAFTNRLLSMARVGNRFGDVLGEVSREFGRVFRSRQIFGVAAQLSSGRVFRWEVPASNPPVARIEECPPKQRSSLMMLDYPHTFYASDKGKEVCIDAIDDEGLRTGTDGLRPMGMPLDAHSVLAVRLEIGNEWQGRFFLLNGTIGTNHERELRFAQNTMRQVAPALYSLYLFRRLRSRTGAMERARVARELHDTAIQSLIGIEMEVDVLRRQPPADERIAEELGRIQGLLRQEVLNLRELMQSMRPLDVGPHQFLDFIAQLVERFRRDTGLDARFLSELQEVTLPAPVCRELSRVVQEGLVNIRKHSGAASAYVRFGTQNGHWQLIIDDDGRGFPFTGRMTLSELDELHRGPTVIKERVRSIGGDMVLESNPGHGSRLEIKVPQKGYESYG